MKREYFSNVEYNRSKRRTAITLSALLLVVCLAFASLFIVKRDVPFSLIFLLMAVFPILTIPQTLKNYPIDSSKPVVTVTDKQVTVLNQTIELKSITSVRVIIELLPSKLDSENVKILSDMVSVYPGDVYYGNLDVFYVGEDGKKKTLFSHIEGVVGALETFLELGVKNYSLSYSIKKNSVKSEFDFKANLKKRLNEEVQKTSNKSKTKQLI